MLMGWKKRACSESEGREEENKAMRFEREEVESLRWSWHSYITHFLSKKGSLCLQPP